MLLVVVIALFAAFLFAAAASLQQHAAHQTGYRAGSDRAAARHRHRPALGPLFGLVGDLISNRLWLAGWVTNLFGFFAQAVALYLGSVALVQPVLVSQILFALPLASVWARRWPTARDWIAGSAITAGLALFLASRGAPTGDGAADRQRVIMAAVAAMAIIAVLLTVATGRSSLVHATLFAVSAGLCFAVSATLMKLTAGDLVHRGIAATATDWPGYALAASTVFGLLLEQGAFAAGTLPGAVSAMTITNPLASYLIGILAFNVTPPTGAGALAAVAGSGALISLGVLGLAHSPSGRIDPQSGREPPAAARRAAPHDRPATETRG